MYGKVIPLKVKNNLVLMYDPEENVMRDLNGYIIFDIFKFITPNELLVFKENKVNVITNGRDGNKVTLIYL